MALARPVFLPGVILCGISLCVSSVAGAASAESPSGSEQNPIVVTATLGPKTIGESLSSVTVVNDEAIRRQQPLELTNLLEAQPGLNVVSNGSFGKQISVFTRGTGSESTILLVDGVRLKSATSGGAPWMFVPPQLVQRVEIVRGSRSVLYGADAVGGSCRCLHRMRVTRPMPGWRPAAVI